MSLVVTVKNCTNLPNVDSLDGKSDPVTSLIFRGVKQKTKVIKNNLNPEWNETLTFDLKGKPLTRSDKLDVHVKDWERIQQNRLLGQVTIPLGPLINKKSQEINTGLQDKKGNTTDAKISLSLVCDTPGSGKVSKSTSREKISSTSSRKEAATAKGDSDEDIDEAGGVQGKEENEEDDELAENEEGEGDEAGEEEGGAGGGDGGGGGGDGGHGGGGDSRKRKRRKNRHKLSKKPQNIQVRIKIIEGRRLVGANIKPVVRVQVADQSQQTQIKKRTNNPFYNKTMFFNYHMAPIELCDELITFQAFTAHKYRHDSLIGSFKLDIGTVYEADDHAFINKWILLSDPTDSTADVKGYLKICAMVLTAGVEAPVIPESVPDADDIEGNLLQPAGTQLRSATFHLKVYKAEDLPRMDKGFMQGIKKIFGAADDQKELVDPYLKFVFAGRKSKTRVEYSSDTPEWNQELNIAVQLPSMCERMKIILLDWDRVGQNDAIGTVYLSTSSISSPNSDDGWLPTFGPCQINFYGSPREYSDIDEFESLNKGKGEGCSYRGRALIEFSTTAGTDEGSSVTDISPEDCERVKMFMRSRKYALHAAFHEATFLADTDDPIEFEMSIGNNGNKLDSSVPTSSSTTPPAKAVFDGNSYFYLPWNEVKPCVSVMSDWEDISYRLDNLNMLSRIADRLQENLNQIKLSVEKSLSNDEVASEITATLDTLRMDFRKSFHPVPAKSMSTILDRRIQEYRQKELMSLSQSLEELQKQTSVSIDDAIDEIECYLERLKILAQEPQNSIPDIIIWMLHGEKRVAYSRIPAYEVLYSSHLDPDATGQFCGKVQTLNLKFPGKKGEKRWNIPCQLRVQVWFGLAVNESKWTELLSSTGELGIHAETFENQHNLAVWTSKGVGRPKFSDVNGDLSLDKDDFVEPSGWQFEGDWFVNPESSSNYDKDSGRKVFLEDLFENEGRSIPGSKWSPSNEPWTNEAGKKVPNKEEVVLPKGWEWEDKWQIDYNRAVDENGWEYTLQGGYVPVEKNYHLSRRRRWVRKRRLKDSATQHKSKKSKSKGSGEDWEYATRFSSTFHAKSSLTDFVRRRRWHRKLKAIKPEGPPLFVIKDEKHKSEFTIAPRMFINMKKSQNFQMRAYIYQARDLIASDKSGLSDPYARVIFSCCSQDTQTIENTLSPTWDQTLIYDSIEIYGSRDDIMNSPPSITVEIFDHDDFGKPDFLGRTKATPMIKWKSNEARTPKLAWYAITKKDYHGGDILAAFELILDDGGDMPFAPPRKKDSQLYIVPSGIRPVLRRTAIEMLCWGVRDLKRFRLLPVKSPSIELDIGGYIMKTQKIKNVNKDPNFADPLVFFDVMLPKEKIYRPPMNIRIIDHRAFGNKPLVGVHVIKDISQYECDPHQEIAQQALPDVTDTTTGLNGQSDQEIVAIEIVDPKDKTEEKPDKKEEEIDWWSKYYASTGVQNDLDKSADYLDKGYDTLKIYSTELENVSEFHHFEDFVQSYQMYRGKSRGPRDDADDDSIGELKSTLRVYSLPADPAEPLPPKVFDLDRLPSSKTCDCIVRVYIVSGIDLAPKDTGGTSDPYCIVKIGKHKINDTDNHIPNTVNPVFGKMFELSCTLPLHKDLKVSVMDWDMISKDDLIGETVIDLENRYLSKYRPLCGIPETYCSSGVNQWRDAQLPKDILIQWCLKRGLSPPRYTSNTQLLLDGQIHRLNDYERNQKKNKHLGEPEQRLALHVLRSQSNLVPEHIETRSLFNPLMPEIEQGKLKMWVDIFPKEEGAPGPPFDITPRKAKPYELRVIIYNTSDVKLDETSILGDKMSDIFVKGWIQGYDKKLKTDVHYRSLNGEGNFNWRFILPFEYLPAERSVVIKKKLHFWSLDETTDLIPPVLQVQIWDNDLFSKDDFLGTLELNLNKIPLPAKSAKKCTVDQYPSRQSNTSKMASIFEMKEMKGWWPLVGSDDEKCELTGKVEMSIEILTAEEAAAKPAGIGRGDPNQNPHLDPPNRPPTSFLWFTNPLKSCRFIVWPHTKYYCICCMIIFVLIFFVFIFVYSFPTAVANRLAGS